MVINLIGLCGSGKSALSRKLAKYYKLPILTIGQFRKDARKYNRCKKRPDGWGKFQQESQDWLKLYYRAANLRWDNFIISTSGLNKRLQFLLDSTLSYPVNIKLICNKEILSKRLSQRGKIRNTWAYCYQGYEEFNKGLSKNLKDVFAEIVIDTGKLNIEESFKKAVKEIERLKDSYEKCRELFGN